MKPVIAAALAAFSIGSMASVAHAAVYDIGPVTDGNTFSASPIANLNNSTNASSKTFTDFFNFTIPNAGDELTTAGINLAGIVHGVDYDITGIELLLYSGTSTGATPIAADLLGTSGAASLSPQLDVGDLTVGSYYVEALVNVAAYSKGSYNLATTFTSAAPEPESWVLMIAGLGMAGGMMRLARRRSGVLATA